eukprot:1041495-Pelagomonas_calceolata.AAC.3
MGRGSVSRETAPARQCRTWIEGGGHAGAGGAWIDMTAKGREPQSSRFPAKRCMHYSTRVMPHSSRFPAKRCMHYSTRVMPESPWEVHWYAYQHAQHDHCLNTDRLAQQPVRGCNEEQKMRRTLHNA